MFRRRGHFIKRAVHTVTDAKFSLKRLEMNVACAVLNGLKQNQVHKFDDGGLIGQVRHEPFVVRGAGLAHSARNILIGAEFLKNLEKSSFSSSWP